MSVTDLISRQALCEYALNQKDKSVTPNDIMRFPSAEPEMNLNEWCTDCTEYDHEKHCCPRFNKVIRETVEEYKAEPQWNNHTVACLLADLYGDPCACNYNNISEWLPEKCEVIDSCPNPVGVACWEQFLKHRAERRTDGTEQS